MSAHVILVYTHDSIGLGEDGPTHQPIEHLASLRAMPNMILIRPADANEVADFNGAVAELGNLVSSRRPDAVRQAASERLFNRAQPFYVGMVIYVLALLVLFASWLWKRSILQPAKSMCFLRK